MPRRGCPDSNRAHATQAISGERGQRQEKKVM
jgi:hypothetical protein